MHRPSSSGSGWWNATVLSKHQRRHRPILGNRAATKLAAVPPTAVHAAEDAAGREEGAAAPSRAATTTTPDPAGSTLDRPTPDLPPR
jgi:hypothetical protein